MPVFAKLIEQWGGVDAFRTALGNEFLQGRMPPSDAQGLINWEEAGDVIVTHRLVPPDISVVNGGTTIPPRRYLDRGPSPRRRQQPVVDPAKLEAILADGATLVVNNLQEATPTLIDAADELARLVDERVQANLYATWGPTTGFDPHWDDHDVLVVQVEGEKHWSVYGPGTVAPLDHEVDTDNLRPDEPVWEGVLQPGDALYLPRGWWHAVSGIADVSLHLTFGFQRRTAMDYLRWLTTYLAQETAMRVDLPRTPGHVHDAALRATLTRVLAAHPIDAYLAEFTAGLEHPRGLDLRGLSGPTGSGGP